LVKAYAQTPELQQIANLVIIVRGMEDPLHEHANAQAEESTILDEIVRLSTIHNLWGKISAFSLDGQDELAAGYRYLALHGSVFTLTALYEPFGLAPLEAIVAGLPGVVTKNGGPSESLYDAQSGREYGVLIDPADPQDISRGLLLVLSEPKKWHYYHDSGIQRVHDHYTWRQTAQGYLAELENILARREAYSHRHGIPIPRYFQYPTPENEINLDNLAHIYFG
jgi:sucrose-phosphate synthase